MIAPGARVGRYEIEKLLGRGGMGAVYRAHDPMLLRTVAIKLIAPPPPDAPTQTPSTAGRLLREARAVAALAHPNIVSIHDVGVHDDQTYIVMELVEGRTLRTILRDRDASMADRRAWLIDVARGLAAAHRAAIVHRDIKPENVIVRASDRVAKILDFGIARGGATRGATQTTEGDLSGTPSYMAPEQLCEEQVDARADQFAWGVVAYELLSGEHPWPREALASTVLAIVTEAAPSLADRPEIPASFASTIDRALAKKAEERFASMDDLLGALEVQTSGTNVVATSAAATRPRSIARTAPWIALAVCAFAAVIVWRTQSHRSTGSPSPPSSSIPATTSSSVWIASSNPQAERAYEEGLASFRAGSFAPAYRAFEEALAIDPNLGAAHLRLALLRHEFSASNARDHYAGARRARASMSPLDAAMFDAAAPCFEIPARLRSCADALDEIARKFPSDPEPPFFAGFVRVDVPDDAAIASFKESVRRDPSFVPGQGYEGMALASFVGPSAARPVFASCSEAHPESGICESGLIEALSTAGACEEAKRAAARWASANPTHAGAYLYRAGLLLGGGAPYEAVDEALHQAIERKGPEDTGWTPNALAFYGDFDRAIEAARAMEKSVAADSDVEKRLEPTLLLARLLDEVGRRSEAIEILREFVAKSPALDPHSGGGLYVDDFTIEPRALLHRMGALEPSEWITARDAWVAKELAISDDRFRKTSIWFEGWARAATDDEALAAIDLLGDRFPLGPPVTTDARFAPTLGMLYVRAGKLADGAAHLATTLADCDPLNDVLDYVQAHASYGDAERALGKTKEACAAYEFVVARWGNAKSSVTAAHAKEARKSVCP